MTTPKERYEARQKAKRMARGDDPEAKTDEQLALDMFLDFAERLILAFEGIEMNTRVNK